MSLATLKTLHLLLLCGFLGATSALLILAAINRLRVRRVVLTWRRGRWPGVPPGPAVFTLAVIVLLGYAWHQQMELAATILSGYLVGAGFWSAASALRCSVLVSEYGFVRPCNDYRRGGGQRQRIAWSRVTDYARVEEGRHVRYLFFYREAGGARRRADLHVPARHRAAFRRLVETKVDDRFAFDTRQLYGSEALEE